jgi:hypothetical protein
LDSRLLRLRQSHLLKILSHIVDGQPLANGTKPADVILPKIEDEIVKDNLRKATAIPSCSILFNIDQKFDGIGDDHSAPILEVFVKVLNELQGYCGKQGYIAKFEHDLDIWSRWSSRRAASSANTQLETFSRELGWGHF